MLEKDYLNILKNILEIGSYKEDRTGVGCYSLFGKSLRHSYKDGFPLLTTKKMFTKGIIGELIWFLKGTEDPTYLIENNIRIWDAWMQEEDGKKKLPHTYGVKWRNFDGFDQIQFVIDEINNDPNSRRMLVNAWDCRNIKNAALPWCHVLFQFNIELDKYKDKAPVDGKKGDISISVYQRSADFFLGVPFNLASYSFLLYMIGEITGYRPKEMYYTFGDCHIYKNHIEQCKTQISRDCYEFPSLRINNKKNINDYELSDFEIVGYKSHPTIKGEVAV